jgi:elongation factor 1-beta
MANVLVSLKVFPESDEVDLDKLAEEIEKRLPKGFSLMEKAKEPIAFGLNSLVLAVVMPEQTEGGTESLEESISQIKGVSHVEVTNITRLGF